MGETGTTAPTKALMSHFDAMHRTMFGIAAHFSAAKDANLLARLWRERQNDNVTVEMLIDEFFSRPTQFARSNGFTVGIFYSQIGKLLLQISPAPTFDWFSECKRLHDRTCNGQYGHALKMEIDSARHQ